MPRLFPSSSLLSAATLLLSSSSLFLLLILSASPNGADAHTNQNSQQQRAALRRQAEELYAQGNADLLLSSSRLAMTSEDTLPPTNAPPPLTPDEQRKANRDRSIEVDSSTWIWVPFVVLGIFFVFLASSRKFKSLEGESLRNWLTHYVSLEALVDSLEGADEEVADEQRKVEYGHLFFEFTGVVVLIFNFFLGNGQSQPHIFMYLSLLQIVLLWLAMIGDIVMIRLGYLRVVRSVNNKLRFAHCTYQALLFAVDELSSKDLSSLPLDVYFWAVTHYTFEAVGLFLEGLNMIGMSEFVIILLIVQKTMTALNQTTGAVSAFGITSIALSCASIVVGTFYKIITSCRRGEDVFSPAPSEDSKSLASGHGHGHGGHKKASNLEDSKASLSQSITTPLQSPSNAKISPHGTPANKSITSPTAHANNNNNTNKNGKKTNAAAAGENNNDDYYQHVDDDEDGKVLLPAPAVASANNNASKKRAMTTTNANGNAATTAKKLDAIMEDDASHHEVSVNSTNEEDEEKDHQ